MSEEKKKSTPTRCSGTSGVAVGRAYIICQLRVSCIIPDKRGLLHIKRSDIGNSQDVKNRGFRLDSIFPSTLSTSAVCLNFFSKQLCPT